jgi:hypothetical protein
MRIQTIRMVLVPSTRRVAAELLAPAHAAYQQKANPTSQAPAISVHRPLSRQDDRLGIVRQPDSCAAAGQKITTIPRGITRVEEWSAEMRMKLMIVASSIAGLTLAATTAFAKGLDGAFGATRPASSCSAYEQAADGSWQRLPCLETGVASKPAPRRSATRSTDQHVR